MLVKSLKPVAIIGGSRTPFTRSFTHYARTSNKELMIATLQDLVKKFKLHNVQLGDVALGAVMKNAEDWNMSRESVLKSGLHPHTPGYDVQRACGTGLETIAQIALKIACGQIESGIGGGCDTNSDIEGVLTHELSWAIMDAQKTPTIVGKIKKLASVKPKSLIPKFPEVKEPQTGLSMGEHTELMVKEWRISREAQDELAYESHQRATMAYETGFFSDLVFEYKGATKDTILRPDTTLEKLARLKPVFDRSESGTLTAGNSTALTDGASAVLLGSDDFADQYKLP
ncbi:MAG: thiolase family protein, partial [Bacteriovorax sp.]